MSVETEGKLGIVVRVTPDQRDGVLLALRDSDLQFEQLLDTFGADLIGTDEVEADAEKGIEALPATLGCIEVTYYLRSYKHDTDVRLKMQLPYGATYYSIIEIYLSVYLAERELAEMFGLVLEGHPNPKRLVTNENFVTPLLKSVEIRGKDEVWPRQ